MGREIGQKIKKEGENRIGIVQGPVSEDKGEMFT